MIRNQILPNSPSMPAKVFAFLFISMAMFLTQVLAEDEKIVYYNDGCSEEACGAIVSKCMLLKSCNCSMTPADLAAKNCTCCRDCVTCLGDLFSKCCACVGLCKSNDTHDCLSLKSTVQYLHPTEEQMGLYKTITEGEYEENLHGMKIKSFPITESQYFSDLSAEHRDMFAKIPDINCTVAFLPKCMPDYECQFSCKSLGASSVRWFYTGCCQCIGQYCMDFGVSENLCEYCKDLEEENSAYCKKGRPKITARFDEL